MSPGKHGVIGYVRCWSNTQAWGVRGLLEISEARVIMSALYWDLCNNYVCQKNLETYLSCLPCADMIDMRFGVFSLLEKLGDVPIMSALYSNLGDCKLLAKQHYNE